MLSRYLFFILLFISSTTFALAFQSNASYDVCFTPGQNCTQKIVDIIGHAQTNVWVQAYSFTSRPITRALVQAKRRGVNVQVILDKEILQYPRNTAQYLVRHQIPVWIDNQPAIAHNKIMIIDSRTIITGSFNFTYAAQKDNAENLLIISDSNLANIYLNNWYKRQSISVAYSTTVNRFRDYSKNVFRMKHIRMREL